MSKQADIRVRLDEIKSRLNKLDEVNSADIGLQMSVHYAVDTMLQKDLPATAAALTAVLDLADRLEWEGQPENHGGDGLDYGRTFTAERIRNAVVSALGGDRG